MSGKRRISVDEAQWNVLQRQARQLDDLRVNAPKLVADVQRQTQSELARVSERLSGRQQAVERTVSALSEQTRALEADTSPRLREQASEMRQQLADTAGQLRAETSAALARQQQAWRSELAAERDRQREELARLESEIRRTRRAAARAAETWPSDAGLMRDLIRDELPHERFAPENLAALDRRLVTAQATADQANSEAALAGPRRPITISATCGSRSSCSTGNGRGAHRRLRGPAEDRRPDRRERETGHPGRQPGTATRWISTSTTGPKAR